jgi:geranylgeranyl diphosphate synthase type II
VFDLEKYFSERRTLVDRLLDAKMPPETTRPAEIHRAMRYAVLAGGKRLRPLLCLAAAEAAGGSKEKALVPAAAIELLHTYTLVHDDLPAMDDDKLRRGQPTVHVKFGEANAILAGDALLTLAFEWLAECSAPPPYEPNRLALELARAAGSRGVIGGQVEDIAAEGKTPTAEQVDYIHEHKTGDLIRVAVRMGAITAGASEQVLEALSRYGQHIGLAFQIADDILNATSTPEKLGKAAGSDAQRGKVTYVAVHGLDRARARGLELVEQAVVELKICRGETQPLAALAHHVVARTN